MQGGRQGPGVEPTRSGVYPWAIDAATPAPEGDGPVRHLLAFVLALSLPCVALADDATGVAKGFLARGSALFDARDAAGLAATYAEDARV